MKTLKRITIILNNGFQVTFPSCFLPLVEGTEKEIIELIENEVGYVEVHIEEETRTFLMEQK